MKAGWTDVALGEVAALVRDVIEPSAIPDGTLYVGLENIERGGAFADVCPVANGELASAKFTFDSSQILYGKLRPNLGKVARPRFAGVCSTDILPIEPGPHIDRNYLAHFLLRPATVELAARRATGANLPRLAPTELMRFRLPLPALDEQRRLAATLDSADTLRQERRRAGRLLDSLASSLFVSLFGDPVRNPRGWPVTHLGSLGTLDRGVSRHRPRNAPELLGGPYPLIQTGDVARSGEVISTFASTYSEAGLRQSRLWPAGTLCITIAANIAMTGIIAFDACFPDSVVGFTADAETTAYVQAWLRFLQPTLERSAPESAQKNINLAILRGLPVPTPPASQVSRFAKEVAAIRSIERAQAGSLSELDALFGSLQYRAFNGTL